jgi:hypothetical protein
MHAAVLDDMAALAADFTAWHIWRSRGSSGTETGWNATRKGRRRGAVPGTAASPASLRALLGQQEALRQDPAA